MNTAADGKTVQLSPACIQPIASDDIAAVMAEVALGAPVNAIVEVAGPQRMRLSDLVRGYLAAKNDPRTVVADVHARYVGAELTDATLVPGPNPRLGTTRFEDWLGAQLAKTA
ncbi:MAG: hypothetical protein V4569_02520 [Pseudomonadota bacterium]